MLFNYTIFCENPIHTIRMGVNGVIDVDRIIVENPGTSDFYLSGPPLMIEYIGQLLRKNGILSNRIFVDEW